MHSSLALINCTAFTQNGRRQNCHILIDGDKIQDIGDCDYSSVDNVVDLQGAIVCPGLIDIHVNGGGRRLVMDGTYESICEIAKAHARYGTTAMLPTTVAWSDDQQLTAIDAIIEASEKGTGGAGILGIHMEGPFLNPEKAGAHNKKYLGLPSVDRFEKFRGRCKGLLRMITLAPELEDAYGLIRHAVSKGTLVSMGHTVASYDEAKHGIDCGIRVCAHIFNAMPGISARMPGVAGAVLDDPRVMAELITDGVHVHPSLVRLIIEIKGLDSVALVTDGTPPSGTEDRAWDLGDATVEIKGYTGYLPNGTIAGSALTMGSALKVAKEITGLNLEDCLPMTSLNQARLLGLESKKGTIEVGKDADLVVFVDEESLDVKMTIVSGKIVHAR